MTPEQRRILEFLAPPDWGLTLAHDVASACGLAPRAAGQKLRALERRGWVVRRIAKATSEYEERPHLRLGDHRRRPQGTGDHMNPADERRRRLLRWMRVDEHQGLTAHEYAFNARDGYGDPVYTGNGRYDKCLRDLGALESRRVVRKDASRVPLRWWTA